MKNDDIKMDFGLLTEAAEADEAKAAAYVRLETAVSGLTNEVEALKNSLNQLHDDIENMQNAATVDMTTQFEKAGEEAVKSLKLTAAAIAADLNAASKPIKEKRWEDFISNAVFAVVCAAIFTVPAFAAGWYFSNDTAERILWNQSYPNQAVTTFTPAEDFEKMQDNQKKYLDTIAAENLKNTAGK